MKKNLFSLMVMAGALTASAQSPRMVLFEEFTGENCGPCASANPGINATLKQPINQTRVAAIKWEVPIPSAPTKTWSLYQTNKNEINWRFRGWNGGTGSSILNPPSVNGYGYPSQWTSSDNITSGVNSAPQGRLDGQFLWYFNGGGSNHGGALNNTGITAAANVPSPFTINMQRAWGPNGASITVTVAVQASMNYTATGNLVFRTVMVEREIHFETAPGSNGEKEFHDVAIRSYPDIQNGTALPMAWTNGQSHTFTLNCVIPTYVRKKTEIAFVGFIQDDGNREVQQAYRLEKEALPYDAVALAPKVEPACSSTLGAVVTVSNNGLNPITAMTITPYTDGNPVNVTQWAGNLPAGGTVAVTLDAFSAPTGAGAHSFSYAVTAIDGNDLEASNNGNSAQFLVVDNYQGTPVQEGFVGTFPPADWGVIGKAEGKPWVKTAAVGAWGLDQASALLPFFTNTLTGDVQELVVPPVDLTGTGVPLLEFDFAYAQRTDQDMDKLEVLASKDCGATWESLFAQTGGILASTFDKKTTSWIPQPQNWRHETIQLTNFNSSTVLLKFVGTSDNGNNLYLDNINLRSTSAADTTVGLAENIGNGYSANLFPNPTSGLVTLSVKAPVSGSAEIHVTNTLGQTISVKTAQFAAGINTVSLDLSQEASGFYNISIKAGNGTINKKVTVTH